MVDKMAMRMKTLLVNLDLERGAGLFSIVITAASDVALRATILANGDEFNVKGWQGLLFYGTKDGGITLTNSTSAYNTLTWDLRSSQVPPNGVYDVQILGVRGDRLEEWGRGKMTVRLNPSRDYLPEEWISENPAYKLAVEAKEIADEAHELVATAVYSVNGEKPDAAGNVVVDPPDIATALDGHNTDADAHGGIAGRVDAIAGAMPRKADLGEDGRVLPAQLPAIPPGLTLGETETTAFRGDLGKAAHDHSQKTGNAHGETAAQINAVTSVAAPVTALAAPTTADVQTHLGDLRNYLAFLRNTNVSRATVTMMAHPIMLSVDFKSNRFCCIKAPAASSIAKIYVVANDYPASDANGCTRELLIDNSGNASPVDILYAGIAFAVAPKWEGNKKMTRVEAGQIALAQFFSITSNGFDYARMTIFGQDDAIEKKLDALNLVADGALPKSGGTMTGPIAYQDGANYTTQYALEGVKRTEGDVTSSYLWPEPDALVEEDVLATIGKVTPKAYVQNVTVKNGVLTLPPNADARMCVYNALGECTTIAWSMPYRLSIHECTIYFKTAATGTWTPPTYPTTIKGWLLAPGETDGTPQIEIGGHEYVITIVNGWGAWAKLGGA